MKEADFATWTCKPYVENGFSPAKVVVKRAISPKKVEFEGKKLYFKKALKLRFHIPVNFSGQFDQTKQTQSITCFVENALPKPDFIWKIGDETVEAGSTVERQDQGILTDLK